MRAISSLLSFSIRRRPPRNCRKKYLLHSKYQTSPNRVTRLSPKHIFQQWINRFLIGGTDSQLHCPAIPEPAAPCCGIWAVRRTLAPDASAGECRSAQSDIFEMTSSERELLP